VLQERIVVADQGVPFVRSDVGDSGDDFDLDGGLPGDGHATARAWSESTKLATAVKAWKI
jgi:hypothetical protein